MPDHLIRRAYYMTRSKVARRRARMCINRAANAPMEMTEALLREAVSELRRSADFKRQAKEVRK